MSTLEVQGKLWERFRQAATLLYTLDPVRGEPTAHGLDQDPFELEGPRDRLLKRKFLDSVALVCAVEKKGDAVSAACLEECMPAITVLRIASNSGVSENTLKKLREIIQVLNEVASGAVKVSDVEANVLLRIVQIDILKIGKYMDILRHANDIIEKSISDIESLIIETELEIRLPPPHNFLDWFKHIYSIRDLPPKADPEVLVRYVIWAQRAKYHYLPFLKLVFSRRDQLPRGIYAIFKLGRYGIASKAFLQLSSEFPALFNPMIVESLRVTPKPRFCPELNSSPLSCVLKRVVNNKAEEILPQLARLWNTKDAEAFFRESCTFDPVVHAELQLRSFYDNNPQLKPAFRFIGVSKKSCYLCSLFLRSHPESFGISSCHQKLYRSWDPPSTENLKVYNQYKSIIKDMSELMEATARKDLDARLMRRAFPDSTAGVSLSGLTDSPPLGGGAPLGVPFQQNRGKQTSSESQRNIPFRETPTNQMEDMGLTLADFGQRSVNSDDLGQEDIFEQSEHDQLQIMVFHFRRSDDPRKQDIVCMKDIYDPTTKTFSWTILVELLSTTEAFGLGFKEDSEYLFVNDLIRVAHARQFLACLQYLRNTRVLTANVSARSFNDLLN